MMNADILAEQDMEHALLTAGWKRVHASPFWRAPSGFLAHQLATHTSA